MKTLKFLAFCITLFWCSVAAAAGVTKKEIRDMMASMDRAILAENLSEFSNYLSEKATFKLDYKSQQRAGTKNFVKKQYVNLFYKRFTEKDDYKFERDIINIDIISPMRALVTSKLLEKISTKNLRVTASSRERFTIERIDGTLQVTVYSSKTRIKGPLPKAS